MVGVDAAGDAASFVAAGVHQIGRCVGGDDGFGGDAGSVKDKGLVGADDDVAFEKGGQASALQVFEDFGVAELVFNDGGLEKSVADGGNCNGVVVEFVEGNNGGFC